MNIREDIQGFLRVFAWNSETNILRKLNKKNLHLEAQDMAIHEYAWYINSLMIFFKVSVYSVFWTRDLYIKARILSRGTNPKAWNFSINISWQTLDQDISCNCSFEGRKREQSVRGCHATNSEERYIAPAQFPPKKDKDFILWEVRRGTQAKPNVMLWLAQTTTTHSSAGW